MSQDQHDKPSNPTPGTPVTVEELNTVPALGANGGEITDDELKNVAGGFSAAQYIAQMRSTHIRDKSPDFTPE